MRTQKGLETLEIAAKDIADLRLGSLFCQKSDCRCKWGSGWPFPLDCFAADTGTTLLFSQHCAKALSTSSSVSVISRGASRRDDNLTRQKLPQNLSQARFLPQERMSSTRRDAWPRRNQSAKLFLGICWVASVMARKVPQRADVTRTFPNFWVNFLVRFASKTLVLLGCALEFSENSLVLFARFFGIVVLFWPLNQGVSGETLRFALEEPVMCAGAALSYLPEL